jgi:TatA/E family protein of Tat protein translocase
MLGIGSQELLFILALALLLFGSKKLPEITRSIAKTLQRLKETTEEIKRDVALDSFLEEEEQEDSDIYPPEEIKEESPDEEAENKSEKEEEDKATPTS